MFLLVYECAFSLCVSIVSRKNLDLNIGVFLRLRKGKSDVSQIEQSSVQVNKDVFKISLTDVVVI